MSRSSSGSLQHALNYLTDCWEFVYLEFFLAVFCFVWLVCRSTICCNAHAHHRQRPRRCTHNFQATKVFCIAHLFTTTTTIYAVIFRTSKSIWLGPCRCACVLCTFEFLCFFPTFNKFYLASSHVNKNIHTHTHTKLESKRHKILIE